MGEGWSTKWLSNRSGGEWDWKIFSNAVVHDDASAGSRDDDGKDRSVPSAESSVGGTTPNSVSQDKRLSSGSRGVSISTSPAPSSSRVSRLSTPGRPGVAGRSVESNHSVSHSPKAASTRQSSASSSRAPPISSSGYTYPVSPRQTRHNPSQQQHNTLDPHPHPTPPPPPASALSIWLVAHRYAMPGLSSLALAHMMNT